MRYLLIVVGLLGVLLGVWGVGYGNPNARPSGELFIQLGALCLVVGLATVDIVEAIKAKRQGG
jgi:hypothetical protein